MAIETYKKKIEQYIKDKDSTTKRTEPSKGLLAPKSPMDKSTGNEQDPVNTIGEFVYMIRKKRQELRLKKRSKK